MLLTRIQKFKGRLDHISLCSWEADCVANVWHAWVWQTAARPSQIKSLKSKADFSEKTFTCTPCHPKSQAGDTGWRCEKSWRTEGNTKPEIILTRGTKNSMFEEPYTPHGDQKWIWFGIQALLLVLTHSPYPDRAVLSWAACYKSLLHTEVNRSDNSGLSLKW